LIISRIENPKKKIGSRATGKKGKFLNLFVEETLGGLRVIKAFNSESQDFIKPFPLLPKIFFNFPISIEQTKSFLPYGEFLGYWL